MLDTDITKKIENFVYTKPRTIQEIAQQLKRNWRTADRYVAEIEKNFGTISTRVFRENTRGALKIVYWSGIEKFSNSVFQEELEKKILLGKDKTDFSGFDIFQYVKENKKEAWIKKGKDEVEAGRLIDFKELLDKAEKQVLFFSGNLSFINFDDGEVYVFDLLERLVKKSVNIKVICRVDIASIHNIKKLLSLNFKYGKQLVEIHHSVQPLRVSVIDNKFFNMKEVKYPEREKELKEKTYIFYTIKDKEWVEWMQKIFWKMFNSSISAETRMKEMERIKE